MARLIEMMAVETNKRIGRVERHPNNGEGNHPVEIARVECSDDELFDIIDEKIHEWDASHISLPPYHPLS